jgi:hypothetical protein
MQERRFSICYLSISRSACSSLHSHIVLVLRLASDTRHGFLTHLSLTTLTHYKWHAQDSSRCLLSSQPFGCLELLLPLRRPYMYVKQYESVFQRHMLRTTAHRQRQVHPSQPDSRSSRRRFIRERFLRVQSPACSRKVEGRVRSTCSRPLETRMLEQGTQSNALLR